jgi:hypothetical protein
VLPPLPDPIADIVVPEWFSPSKWHRMEQCALSAWADEQKVLPDSVNAIVGRVLHAARERVLKGRLVGPKHTLQVRSAIETARRLEEASIEASDVPLGVPLIDAFGQRRWLQRTAWLESWALGLSGRHPSTSVAHSSGGTPANSFALGVEQWWSSAVLRLRGRPDEARLTEGGHIEVTDYKTGFVVGRSGQISGIVETQIHLYLLMAETLGGRPAQGVLHAGVTTAVPWDDDRRKHIQRRVSEFCARFPAGATIPATAAATPGAHCSGCSLRPRCESYLRQAPSWWPNTGDHPRPLPSDVWGRVSAVSEDELGLTVRIDDAAGRRVLVRGLQHTSRPDVANLRALFLFNLEPTEDAVLHGRRMHPRSFHQRSPGPRWLPARRARLFGLMMTP